ncbi:drug/metabolite transporter (DMT)-like permease [Salirhabdus euzebyi]|uniref:Drug/metabolite transporter (DMT)-like permease n=1 Tax=Salirhabdus euzebyi TaxID=394506 RepID=A0A841PYW4_9BACI|nr:DMT family transporter [Salirhabdus euzebyi]MBB6452331.1 drug/metabolite transporter (DMT)-like permease [Salirhabdus euzebyi]
MKSYTAYFLTILGASFWGLTGLFVEALYRYGFTPWEVVTLRLTTATLLLFLFLIFFSPKHLKIKGKHIPHFFGLGVLSIVLFNWCYFKVMEQTSIPVAVVLLYTSPIFVTILSRITFQETITKKKVVALVLTIVGCSFVIGLIPFGGTNIPFVSIILGLLSAFFCAIYSIIGKFVTVYYHFLTITIYTLLAGTIFIFPTSQIWKKTDLIFTFDVLLNIGGVAVISTIFAYTLYTFGLAYIESSKASILASMEPIVAVLIGVFVFGDRLTSIQLLGIFLVIFSAFITVFHRKRKIKRKLKWKKALKGLNEYKNV